MAFFDVMATVSRMMATAEAAAAIGAHLSLLESDQAADPEIVKGLRAVVDAAGLAEVDTLPAPQRAMVLGMIRTFIREADVLLTEPARPPGWTTTDPVVLDGWGRASMMMPGLMAGAAPELAEVTSFLDVGTGVGLLAIAAAGVWPAASIVGIDVWEPALERARANVTGAGLADRITLRNQDVTALADVDVYDCVWLPSFFLRDGVLRSALPKVVAAVRPGGTVVVARFDPVPDPLAQATWALRTIRAGGCDISAAHAGDLLRAAGCTRVRPLERTWPGPVSFVVGQRPRT